MPALLSALGGNLVSWSFKTWIQLAKANFQGSVQPFMIYMSLAFLGIILWFLAAWELVLRCSALSRMMLGLEDNFAEAYQHLKKRAWSIFGAYNLAVVPPLVVLCFWGATAFASARLVPAEPTMHFLLGGLIYGAIGFALTVSLAITSLYGAILMASAALEEANFGKLMSISLHLVKMRPMRGGSFVCLLSIAIILASFALEAPVTIASTINVVLNRQAETASDPALLHLFATAFDMVTNIVSFAVAYVGYALFYRDLQLRLDGVDLQKRLAALE